MKEAVKKSAGSSGIMTINKNIAADVEKLVQKYVNDAMQQGVDLDTLGPEQLKMIVAMNAKATNRVISGSSPEGRAITEKLMGFLDRQSGDNVVDLAGKKIDTRQGIIGGKSVKELMESGQVQKGTDGLKKNDKILERDMFNNSNLNKTDAQIKARLDAGNKKSVKNMEDNRKLTDEEIRDYELELGDSETWLNKGTFGEAEQALKNKKAYEAKMFAEYKSIGGSRRPGGPKASERDSLPIRLMKNFEKELKEADLMAEGYSKDQANVLIKARQKMTSGEEMNPNESLLRVKEEFADNAGVDVEDFKDIDFEIEIPEYAKGGRAGLYTGGMVDVEPNLSDIGHGSDALMARTRLVSPDGQATTSTGLNYLLAEDNDNIRVPFSAGGGGRRAFLKLLATLGGGVAAAKTGILGIGEGGAKKAITETVKQSAGSGGQVPPYFLNLVSKIKTLGDDTLATKDKAIAKKYKDYTMEEDFAGNIEIIKKGDNVSEDVFMSYKVDDVPIKGKKGSTKVEEYEEYTARPDREGKMKDIEQGVPDEVVQEGTIFEDNMTEFGKADGGRIGFSAGGGNFLLSKLGINSTSRRFLEKVFGKQGFETMIENDPRMHRGMLEVVEMFRNKDKEGLKMYLQKFMPDMGDAEIEKFIVGDSGTEGIAGQLIRLGSGREYQNLIKMSKEADQIRKLDDFDIDGVSKNAEGGRIGLFLGGGLTGLTAGKSLFKNMLKFLSKDGSHKKSPAELLQMYNPKQFNKLLNNPMNTGKISPATGETADQMIRDTMSKTQNERAVMVGDIIESARKIKGTDDDIIAYKIKIIKDMMAGGIDEKTARSFAEHMGEQMVRAAGKKSPPKITEQGLLELENIQKNLLTKDRKLQATGGLTTMLGE